MGKWRASINEGTMRRDDVLLAVDKGSHGLLPGFGGIRFEDDSTLPPTIAIPLASLGGASQTHTVGQPVFLYRRNCCYFVANYT
jgi:hypothetical protein